MSHRVFRLHFGLEPEYDEQRPGTKCSETHHRWRHIRTHFVQRYSSVECSVEHQVATHSNDHCSDDNSRKRPTCVLDLSSVEAHLRRVSMQTGGRFNCRSYSLPSTVAKQCAEDGSDEVSDSGPDCRNVFSWRSAKPACIGTRYSWRVSSYKQDYTQSRS